MLDPQIEGQVTEHLKLYKSKPSGPVFTQWGCTRLRSVVKFSVEVNCMKCLPIFSTFHVCSKNFKQTCKIFGLTMLNLKTIL